MVKEIIHSINAEILILYKSTYVKIVLVLSVLLCLYAVNLSSFIFDRVPLYYTSQLLMASLVLGVFAIILVSAFLCGNEFACNTWGIRLSGSKRIIAFSSKLSAVILSSIVITFIYCIVGVYFDFASTNADGGSIVVLLSQYLIVCSMHIFWGTVAFILAMLLKSTWSSFVICLIYYYFEQVLSAVLPLNIKSLLPVYSMQGIIYHFFDQTGAFGFDQNAYRSMLHSTVVFTVYLAALLTLLRYLLKKRQFDA